MNSRVVAAASRALLAQRSTSVSQARNSSYYKPPASWYAPTYNELPVPQGSWKTAHDAAQRKYNKHLIVGIAMFIFTVGFIKTTDIVEFNARIPPLPED